MAEIVALLILAVSLTGIFVLTGRKIPAILALPETQEPGGNILREVNSKFSQSLRKLPFLKNFSWQAWLEKNLYKIRVIALKADNKISNYLIKKRSVAGDEGGALAPGQRNYTEYWSDVKKFVKTKAAFKIKPVTPVVEEKNLTGEVVDEARLTEEIAVIEPVQAEAQVIPPAAKTERARKPRKRTQKKSISW